MLLPCCLLLCYYKLAAECGNLRDQSRQAEELRTQEMCCLDSGCMKLLRCRDLLSKALFIYLFIWPWCLGLCLVSCSTGKLGNCPHHPGSEGLDNGRKCTRKKERRTTLHECGHWGKSPKPGEEYSFRLTACFLSLERCLYECRQAQRIPFFEANTAGLQMRTRGLIFFPIPLLEELPPLVSLSQGLGWLV